MLQVILAYMDTSSKINLEKNINLVKQDRCNFLYSISLVAEYHAYDNYLARYRYPNHVTLMLTVIITFL